MDGARSPGLRCHAQPGGGQSEIRVDWIAGASRLARRSLSTDIELKRGWAEPSLVAGAPRVCRECPPLLWTPRGGSIINNGASKPLVKQLSTRLAVPYYDRAHSPQIKRPAGRLFARDARQRAMETVPESARVIIYYLHQLKLQSCEGDLS